MSRAALLSCSLFGVFACGTGPQGDPFLVPSPEEQHVAAVGQRVAPLDPQLPSSNPQQLPSSDPQQVPPVNPQTGSAAGATIAPGEQGCTDFCHFTEEAKCGQDVCKTYCGVAQAFPGPCGSALVTALDCFAANVGDDCMGAQEACLTRYETDIESACANDAQAIQAMINDANK
ncbi:MAG TPA: hypothetical protein VHM70_02310 [Polyangiaceae bacterium]|nr:hypothetical protein [Polyangiaceae bacterium]